MKPKPRSAAVVAAYSLSGSVLGGVGVGYLVGEYRDWNPTAAAAGLFLGIGVGFYNLARAMWRKE